MRCYNIAATSHNVATRDQAVRGGGDPLAGPSASDYITQAVFAGVGAFIVHEVGEIRL